MWNGSPYGCCGPAPYSYPGYAGYGGYAGSGPWFAIFIILFILLLIFGGYWYFSCNYR